MTTDPKMFADEIEQLTQGETPSCVLNLRQEEWRTIVAALRALPLPDPGSPPVEGWKKGAEAMKEAAAKVADAHIHQPEGWGARSTAQSIGVHIRRLPLPPPPAEPSRAAQEEPEPWPAGCIKPGSCGRHEQCMYAMSADKCRHYGRNLAAEVHAYRKPALAAARQEGGEHA